MACMKIHTGNFSQMIQKPKGSHATCSPIEFRKEYLASEIP